MAITLGIDPALVLFETDRDRLAVRVAAAIVAQEDEKRQSKASAPSTNSSIDDDE